MITNVPAEEIEAVGEQRLHKKPIVKNELKFREHKSDWKDICLYAGFRRIDHIWLEFTPERQQLLQERFPDAAHREMKRYNDSPSLV